MNILVPTDLSENAAHAARYAARIAQATESSLTLLYVCTPPLTRNRVAEQEIADEMDKLRSWAADELRKLQDALSREYAVPCEFEVETGGVVDEVIRFAASHNVNLIVMGTKGAGRIEKFLFGSNTAEIIEATPCPVLAVPATAPLTKPAKVVFATNFYDSDPESLKQLATLAAKLQAEVTILHVAREDLKSDHDLIEQYAKAVAHSTGQTQPHFRILPHDDIQAGINAFIDSTGTDMIALSTRKRTLFERLFDASLTKEMAYQARLPLLAFHAVSHSPAKPDH